MHITAVTFNLIGHHVENKFNVCALCITCDELPDFKLTKMSSVSYDPCFPKHEMYKFLIVCCLDQITSHTCSYFSQKEANNVQNSAIHALKFFSSTYGTTNFDR